MRNTVIITPVYNDWESFTKLIDEINKTISSFEDISFRLIVINDGSKEKAPPIKLPTHIQTIEILNMKINQGHAICLANGIKYALNNYEFDNLILMPIPKLSTIKKLLFFAVLGTIYHVNDPIVVGYVTLVVHAILVHGIQTIIIVPDIASGTRFGRSIP